MVIRVQCRITRDAFLSLSKTELLGAAAEFAVESAALRSKQNAFTTSQIQKSMKIRRERTYCKKFNITVMKNAFWEILYFKILMLT